MTVYTRVSEEVAVALREHRPVVALETTLVSHGFSGGRGLTVAIESRAPGPGGRRRPGYGRDTGRCHSHRRVPGRTGAFLGCRSVGPQGRARDLAACLAQGAMAR